MSTENKPPAPVPPESPQDDYTRNRMQKIARMVDNELPDGYGYAVLVFRLGTRSRLNYVSNGRREDVVSMLREFVARCDANPEQYGKHV